MTQTTQNPISQDSKEQYSQEIAAIIQSAATPKVMRDAVTAYHENDIADALDLLNAAERQRLYRLLDSETLANVFEYSGKLNYISELSIRRRLDVLSELESATAAQYLRGLERGERAGLIELMADDVRGDVALLNSFDEDEIGSHMSTNFILIQNGLGIRDAMHALIDQAAEHDNISTIYVVSDDGTLDGAVDLKDLIIARDGSALESITMTSYPYVYATETIENNLERLKDYSEDSIPVLDARNKLIGVLTSQEITQIVGEELGEDYAMLAGLSAEEDLREPLKESVSKRLPWLIILFGLGMIVSSVVGLFETVVAKLTLIITFQSLILDMAGNVGTQSLAVTIRVLMDEQISHREKIGLIWKETRVGLINGLILGVLSFVLIGLYLVFFKAQPYPVAFAISLCTGLALIVAMLLSSLCGTTVPILFKKAHIDPAVASGPLITTINDLVAVVTYYGLAWILLIHFLHL